MCGIHPNKCKTVNDYEKDKVYLPIGGRVYRIDKCIHQIVSALNAGGISTENSCCGHGKQNGSIILSDGRVIEIYKNLQSFLNSEKRNKILI